MSLRAAIIHRLHAVEDRTSMREQIAIATALLCLLLVGSIAGGAAWFSQHQTSRMIEQQMTDLAAAVSDRLDRGMFNRYREAMVVMAAPPLAPGAVADVDALRRYLGQVKAVVPDYAWIGVADREGTVIAAAGGVLEGASVAERPWFREGLRGPTVQDVHEAKLLAPFLPRRPEDAPFRLIDVAAPLKDRSGAVLGVLGFHLSWSWAEDLRAAALGSLQAGSETDLWVVGSDGAIVLGPRLGAQAFPPERLAEMRRAGSGAFVDGSGASAVLTGFAVSDGHRQFPGLGWTVVARRPVTTAFQSAHTLVLTILLLGGVIAALGVAAASAIAGRVARPIRALTGEADLIGRRQTVEMLGRRRGSLEVVRLSSALRSLLRRIGSAQEAEANAARESRRLAADLDSLRALADADPLTGLLNRRAFARFAEDGLQLFRRYGREVGLLVVDIDHFKAVNDTHGHAAGDAVIRAVAEALTALTRTTDKVARYGGEEFVVLLREIDRDRVALIAERIRARVAATPVKAGDREIRVTVSIGAAMARLADRDFEDLFERADLALCRAKSTGRDRVSLATTELAPLGRAA